MPQTPDYIPVPPQEIPDARHDARQVAIVGLNLETAHLLPNLLTAEGIHVLKVLNPDHEDLSRLTSYPGLDVIIDTTHNPSIASRLRKLPLKKVDVISGLGARLLFCAIREGGEARDAVARSLEEIREAVGLAKDRRAMLQVVLNAAVKTARADSGSLMLLDPSGRQMTIEAAWGLDESVVVSSIQRVGQGVSGSVVRRCEPALINGAVDRQAFAAEYQRPEIVSSICCPLVSEGEALGVLNIASKRADRIFSGSDVVAMEDLAKVAAEVVKTVREAEAGGGQSLGLLNSVQGILAMRYRFEERLNLMLMKLANSFGAKACTYYEFSPAERCFVAKASSSVGDSLLKERPMLLEESFAQRLLKTAHGFCVNSAGKGPRAKKWYMLQPIRSGNELAGALFLYLNSERNQFREEMLLLKRVGDMLAREVSKHRELESIKGQSLKFSAIAQFAADAGSAPGLPELCKMILANARLVLDAGASVLRLRVGDNGALKEVETLCQRNPVWMKDILVVDARLSADAAAAGAPVRIDRLSESAYGSEIQAAEAAMAAPLAAGGEVLGTLALYDKRSADPSGPKRFTEEDQDVLAHFAAQAAKALQRFRPFPAETAAVREEERKALAGR